jgi:acyl-CoA synthetase (AMP-forming)/AMP-acid ligase II
MPTDVQTIRDLFLRSVRNHEAGDALVVGNSRWTYGHLGQLAACARKLFEEYDIRPGGRVALASANSPAYIFAYLGAQLLGAVTVEIIHHESRDVLQKLISDCGASLVLTDREDLLTGVDSQAPLLSMEAFHSQVETLAQGEGNFSLDTVEIDEEAPASILYTSGTTGLPKGVMLTQRNFCSMVDAVLEYLHLSAADRYALVLPLSHSYGKSNLLTSLAAGSCVVLLTNFNDLSAFLSSLSGNRCTVFSGVPFHANLLLKRANLAAYDLSALRALTFSGNHLPWETVAGLRKVLPHALIFSMYGLTESTTRACYLPPELLESKKGSCGKPIKGVCVRIVGEDRTELRPREAGQVEIRGPNIMQGYLGEPELTAQTLMDGWLRTGDLGWMDEEGYLYLIGREKDIIKCAGERISPHEIETVLMSHPQVAEAAVVGVPDSMLGESIKAFIVPRDHFRDTSALRVWCAGRLSHLKIPRYYTFVNELPKTPTGKIKKRCLTEG